MHQQLENFYNHLNDAVRTANDCKKGNFFRKRERVHQFSYCGLNPAYRSYLSFDLDYHCAGRQFEDLDIPVPTIVTTNRENGRSHYLYHLITPVAVHKNARNKPQEFFKAIESELTIILKADPNFTHQPTKNPLHERWILELLSKSYHLSDFQEYFDLSQRKTPIKLPDAGEVNGRNHQLFHTLRY